MSASVKTILLLLLSNIFMLTAWYLHLKIKFLDGKPFFIAALFSWAIAFFEYQVHIPANRIGIDAFSLHQLQILQITISLVMFIPFSMLVMDKKFNWDYVFASILLIFASYFIFRAK